MNRVRKFEAYSKTTGELINDLTINSMFAEELRYKNIILFNKYRDTPLELTVDEIEKIKRIRGVKNPSKVNLIYEKGFFMTSQSEEKLFEELTLSTVGILNMCGYRMNKDGLLKYKNGRAIRTFKALQEYFDMSRYKWSSIQADIDKFSLIKEQYHDDVSYLVMNPLYKSSQYEITMYKFMAFHKELKEHLEPLDYLYLCKKFDIIP